MRVFVLVAVLSATLALVTAPAIAKPHHRHCGAVRAVATWVPGRPGYFWITFVRKCWR